MVRITKTAVAPASPSAMGSRRMGGGVDYRVVSILAGLSTFTDLHKRFRHLGSQFSRATVPATTPPMEACNSILWQGAPAGLQIGRQGASDLCNRGPRRRQSQELPARAGKWLEHRRLRSRSVGRIRPGPMYL